MPPSIPILMYHKVGAPVASKADRFLNVSTSDFERQMAALQRLGYTGITFTKAARGLSGNSTLPRKPVCITFDDGYCCVDDRAAPILREAGWPATVFVPTAFAGRANDWEEETDHPILPIMDWPALRTLEESGWEMAGHTRTHP